MGLLKGELKLVTQYFTPAMLKGLDEAVNQGLAANRGIAVRDAVRDYLKFHGLWKKEGCKWAVNI